MLVDGPPDDEHLVVIAIFDSPLDYPGWFVVRRFYNVNGRTLAEREPLSVVETIEAARMSVPMRSLRCYRRPSDVTSLVECWVISSFS